MTYRLLGISGSLRQQSRNTELLRAAQKNLPADTVMEIANLGDIPFYNADVQEKPAAVQRVLAQMAQADAFVFACPEYNYSIAPALKNIIDWASREPDNCLLSGKPLAIMGAAGGMGSSRAQYHLRQVCVLLNLQTLNGPEVFSNAFSPSFDEQGKLVDAAIIALIKQQLVALIEKVKR